MRMLKGFAPLLPGWGLLAALGACQAGVSGGQDAGGVRDIQVVIGDTRPDCKKLPPKVDEFAQLPRCSAETKTCITNCKSEVTCEGKCITDDKTPPFQLNSGIPFNCLSCILAATDYCGTTSGCANDFTALLCCEVDKCNNQPCQKKECDTQLQAYQACLTTKASKCPRVSDAHAACFP